MFSLIKGQVIKPFLKFTKNLSADQINLSVLKGEGELKSLELDETTLMELLNLPTWLYLRKAQCSNISFKIRWTKLDTHPVCVVIDRVDVELEALDEPRPSTDSMFASYRTGSGKYKLADKVVDGANVTVNTVFIRFYAQAFQASIELSRLTLVSKTPKWQNGPLNLTSLPFPVGDAVLVFKEISWDSVRLVADGLLSELNGIPVKLITNAGRIRLTLKKRLSDSALISSRIQLILDDLLWVLTLSQVEAAIVFLRSLKRSVMLAAEQSRQYAESRAKRQTLGWQSTIKQAQQSTPVAPLPTKQGNLTNMDQYSLAARVFHRYDVVETSYHFCVYRTEIHFCDETREGNQLSQIIVPNGYIKVHLFGLELDWYPYHVELTPQARWHGSRDFREARDNWLASLNRAHFRQMHPTQTKQQQPLDPLLNVPTASSQSIASSLLFPSVELANIQGVFVLRIRDLDVSRVSFPNGPNVSAHKSADRAAHPRDRYAGEELPSNTHLFLATDKKLHCLSENTNFFTAEFRFTYDLRGTSRRPNYNQQSLPCILFAQLKPFYLRFDADTVIWLNAFLLTLHVNLSAFAQIRPVGNCSGDGLKQTNDKQFGSTPIHIRCEALMPRIILPFRDTEQENAETCTTPSSPSGPDALVIQLDQVLIQLLVPPVNQIAASALERLLAKHASVSAVDNLATDRGLHEARTHVPVDTNRFAKLAASASTSDTPIPATDSTDYYLCIHCPHVWAQFLTVVQMFEASKRAAMKPTKYSLYRQSLLEPVPLTVWASIALEALSDAVSTTQPPIQLLIDCDCAVNPLDTERHGLFNHFDKQEPIALFLGHVPPISGGMCCVPAVNQRLPDALDQLLFLCDLVNQLSQVKDQLGLDLNRIYNMPIRATGSLSQTDPQLFYTLAFAIQHRIRFHLVPLDDPSVGERKTLDQFAGTMRNREPASPTRSQNSVGDLFPPRNRQVDRSKSPSVRSRNRSYQPSADLQMDPQKKKGPSYPLLPNNRTVDDLSSKSYSVSDITAVSNDCLDNVSIAGSQDNWLNTYEVLFKLDDELKDSDSASLSSSSGYGAAGSKLPSTVHVLQEVGTELFETDSTRSSQRSTSDLNVSRSGAGRSSRLSQCSSEDRELRESTYEPEVVTDRRQSKPSMIVVFELDGLLGEADATDTNMRSWLKLGPISLTCQTEEQGLSNYRDQPRDHSSSASLMHSWSAFVSVMRHVVHESSAEPQDQPTFQTSVCLHADLLNNWSLRVPSIVPQAAGHLLTCFHARGGLDQLQSILNRGTLFREIPTPLSTMDINLHLKRGFLAVEVESSSSGPSPSNELIKKLHLQQGLSLVLDKNAILSIGLANGGVPEPVPTHSNVLPPASTVSNDPDEAVPNPSLQQPLRSTGHSNLLKQYQQENVQLKDNIRLLNSTIAKLNVELATARHMLDLMQQR